MANHKSAIKRHKQSEVRRARNTAVKTTVKTAIKKVRESAASGDAGQTAELLKKATSLLDKAVSKGVLHRNNASRKISRLTTAAKSASGK